MSKLNLKSDMLVAGAKLLKRLGAGTSGEVWSAINSDHGIVAIKVYEGTEDVLRKAENEYAMAGSFCNAHILKPLGFSSYDSHPVLILPYCEGRSIDGVAAHFTEKMVWRMLEDISQALTDIHGSGCGHFDIKPSNILWNNEKFLLSDFGSCIRLNEKIEADVATDGSSFRYDAPELNREHCTASDIWSLGATVFYLYMGCHVFNGLGGRAQRKDSPLPFMRKSMPELSQLVQKCLDMNPSTRPTAIEISEIAHKELRRLRDNVTQRRARQMVKEVRINDESKFWPDEMI